MASRARRSTTTRCVTVPSSASRRACRSSTHTPRASASSSSSGAPSWRARSPGAALARRSTSRSPWAPCFRSAIWSTAPPCSQPGATRVSNSRSAGCSRLSAAPRSSASSASPSPSPCEEKWSERRHAGRSRVAPTAGHPGMSPDSRPPLQWRLPPVPVLLTAVVLIVCAEVGGASMVRFKLELTRWARQAMLERPSVHGLVGVRDVDERILDEALVKFDAGLRLFHMHAEGMGLVIIATSTVAATVIANALARRVIIALLTGGGAGYPVGYLAWSALIPSYGLERSKTIAEWLVVVPFGSATLVGLRWRAGLVAPRMARAGYAPPPPPPAPPVRRRPTT